ncbi:MAG: polysulfide reductase NrfD [Chloroflexi bacterium]|nr:polysulfide reductase NrfD [Chloroflexota bacterium]
MKLYEWMVKPTAQKEWIDRKGLLMWLAEVGGGIGGGLYLVALFFDSLLGMFLGWLIVALWKGGFHMAYLGKPMRFWRMLSKPGTSWLSRGFILMGLFLGLGAIQLVLSVFVPGTAADVFKWLAAIFAFLTVVYAGFAMNYVRSIEFWNSALLPIVFIATAVLDGFGLTLAIALSGVNNIDILAVEEGIRIVLIVCALLIIVYLWSASYTGIAGKYSVTQLLKGSLAWVFWVGVVAFGIVIPLAVSLFSYFSGEIFAPLLILAIICETIGVFAIKYAILKAGIYRPLVPSPS